MGAPWFDFEVEVFGDEEIVSGLSLIEKGFETFKVPLKEAAIRAAQSVEENIVRGGVPDRFAPLSYRTLMGSPHRLGGPLYAEGNLLEVATSLVHRYGSAYTLLDNEVAIGFDTGTEIAEIAQVQSEGSPSKNIPARDFMRLLESDVDFMQKGMENYVDDLVDRAFSGMRA